MIITPIKTEIFKPLFDPMDLIKYITPIAPKTIIAISTKIISLMENQIIQLKQQTKHDLIKQQSDIYLGAQTCLNSPITIIQDIIMPTAGIDQSNAPKNHFIIWPKNCNKSAEKIWHEFEKIINHTQFAVLLTDTRTGLMRRGTVGICTGFYGVNPLKNYIGKPDLFNKNLQSTKVNIVDSIAAICVLAMGEADEQTPIVKVENVENIEFTHTTQEMVDELRVNLSEDIYLGKMQKNT